MNLDSNIAILMMMVTVSFLSIVLIAKNRQATAQKEVIATTNGETLIDSSTILADSRPARWSLQKAIVA